MSAKVRVPVYECHLRRTRTLVLRNGDQKVNWGGAAAEILSQLMKDAPTEVMYALYLSSALKVIGAEMVAKGGVARVSVTPADVFRGAVTFAATAIVLGHNHPSGDSLPSADDVATTRTLVAAGEVLGVTLMDHVVIGSQGSFTSIRERYPW